MGRSIRVTSFLPVSLFTFLLILTVPGWTQAPAAAPAAAPVAASAPAPVSSEASLFEEIPVVSSTAMLTKSKDAYIPASITTITEEQIAMTPARNIYDLLEIYVPGAIVETHAEGEKVGIRGIISDRNNKLIVLVNGRRLNQNAHSGAIDELENWDLHDIEKIEIIRGPGSVTYGPGAIEGVISITTKNALTSPGTRAGIQYVEKYDSKGAYVSEGVDKKDYNYYAYASIVRTTGFGPKEYIVTPTGQAGYLGGSFSPGGREALDFFNDADDKPQVKAYVEFNWSEFKAWARYTNSGTSEQGTTLNTKTILSNGSQVDMKEDMDQSAEVVLEDKHEFSDVLNLDSMVSWSSTDHLRRDNVPLSNNSPYADETSTTAPNIAANGTDVSSMQNTLSEFSETQLLTKSLLNYTFDEKYKFAVGFENLASHYGPAWGGSDADFRMGDSGNIFGSASTAAIAENTSIPNVDPVTGRAYIVPGGWWDDTLSGVAEANLAFDPKFNVIVSGRTDENTFTNLMFSPRVAIVSDWDKMGVTKLIWQKSVRMNTAEQLYIADKSDQKNDPETVNGYEVDYDVNPTDKLTLETSVYYNSLNDYGWYAPDYSEVLLGKVTIGGVEFGPTYKLNDKFTIGGSQSFTKQQGLKLGPQSSSEISYSAYGGSPSGETLTGTGNDLNNMPTYATKMFAEYKPTAKWTFHLDARVFWDFQGDEDGLTMLENAAVGTANQAAVDQAVSDIRSEGAFKPDARVDLSARYDVNKNVSVTVLATNLLGLNGNKIYAYSSGNTIAEPDKISWINEPRVFGFKVDCKF